MARWVDLNSGKRRKISLQRFALNTPAARREWAIKLAATLGSTRARFAVAGAAVAEHLSEQLDAERSRGRRLEDLAAGALGRGRSELPALRAPRSAGVYVVAGIAGFVKIGRATNIADRILEVQNGHPVRLRLVAIASRDQRDETAIHERWRHLRCHGEWFRLSPELRDWIDRGCPSASGFGGGVPA